MVNDLLGISENVINNNNLKYFVTLPDYSTIVICYTLISIQYTYKDNNNMIIYLLICINNNKK